MSPLVAALAVLLVTALAEVIHARRILAAGRLAFGPTGRPRRWTWLVPFLRSAGLAAFTWGLATLFLLKPTLENSAKAKADKQATRLVFVADLSPSMYLKDSGPDGKLTRQERMREVVEAVLQRVSGNLRFGVVGFYTDALPVVMEARDPELVRNVFNGLPLIYAMKPGQTDLGSALNSATKFVEQLPEGSTRLIILTDGDSINLVPLNPRPRSISDVYVLGLGNPQKGTFIDGHQSRQEGDILRSVASALMGTYVDVNEKHLTTAALGNLVVPIPPPHDGLSLADWAVLAMLLGALAVALPPLALETLGTDWRVTPPRQKTV